METEPEETEEIEEETFEGSEDANANAKSAATTTPGNAAIAAKRTTLELVASLAVPRGKPVRTSSGAASSKSGADAIDEDDDDDDDDDDVEEECDGFEAKAEGTKLRSAQGESRASLVVRSFSATPRILLRLVCGALSNRRPVARLCRRQSREHLAGLERELHQQDHLHQRRPPVQGAKVFQRTQQHLHRFPTQSLPPPATEPTD